MEIKQSFYRVPSITRLDQLVREAKVEMSTSDGEGGNQPAKTERRALGRTEQRRPGQGKSGGDCEHEPVKTQRPAGQSRGNPHGAG